MKRFLSIVLVLVSVFSYAESVQQGCVKTRGRMTVDGQHIPGKGLPGSVVFIKDRTDIGVKDNNGMFSFPVVDKQFRVDSITKKDYVLLDADAVSKTYTHTTDTLFFVMETPDQILQDKLATERRLRRSLQTKLQARENELDSLIAIQKITQEEYQQSLQKLYAEQSENDKLISDMAERYSTLDYDQMDEFYRQVSYYIEHCEFVKADSLLKSCGNIHAQLEAARHQGQTLAQKEEELQKAQKVHQHDIDELAKRCYSYFENFKMQHQNDSAAYYLEQRTLLDTMNAQWLFDFASFIEDYLAQYNKAIKYYGKSLVIWKKELGENHPNVASCYNNIGLMESYLGDYSSALNNLKNSLAIDMKFFGENHPKVASIYSNLGGMHSDLGDYSAALDCYLKSLDINIRAFGESHPKTAMIYSNIGGAYSNQGNYYSALDYYNKALVIEQEFLGEDDLAVAYDYNNIGTIYSYLGEFVTALEYYQKSLAIREKILGMNHPHVAIVYNNIASSYSSLKKDSTALIYFQKSLMIRKKIFGETHSTIATNYNNIAKVYYSQKEYDTALDYYFKAEKINNEILGENHPSIATIYNNIGMVYFAQSNYNDALKYYNKSLEIREKVLGLNHPGVATLYNNIAGLYSTIGNYIQSLEYYEKALKIRENVFGLDHPKTQNIKEKINRLKEKCTN